MLTKEQIKEFKERFLYLPDHKPINSVWDIEILQSTIGVIPYEEQELHALERAIEALEKQIPQKIIETPDKHKYGYCPICGRIYWDKCHVGNYCDSCGQRLEVE